MCMGPKCPCIYPPMPHHKMEFISFRERSPIDRVQIKTKLNNVSKQLITKIKYMARPAQQIQYQIYALSNLLGDDSDSWFRVQKLFTNYDATVNSLTQLDVNNLTKKQIERSQYWLDEYEKLNKKDNQITIFADVAKGILSKIVQVEEQRQQELIKELKEVRVKKGYDDNDADEVAVLQVTQETQPDQPSLLKKNDISMNELETTERNNQILCETPSKSNIQDQQSDHCPPNSSMSNIKRFLENSSPKSPLNLSFCRSQEKSFRGTSQRKTPNKTNCSEVPGGILYKDIITLKKELELIQKDITRLEGKTKKQEFIQNRSALKIKTTLENESFREELKKTRVQTQKDESFMENQKKIDLSVNRSHSAFRKEILSSKSPQNQKYQKFVEKYTSKYVTFFDRIDSQKQELNSIKSQIKLAVQQKITKQENNKYYEKLYNNQ